MVRSGHDYMFIYQHSYGLRDVSAELKHTQRREQRFTRMYAVPLAISSTAVKANMSARRLKLSLKREMYKFPRSVVDRGPR